MDCDVGCMEDVGSVSMMFIYLMVDRIDEALAT